MADAFDTAKNGPRRIVFSLPHGPTVDSVLQELLPYLDKGDIILDGGNEWWEETERRQGMCMAKGIYFLGSGVSGGYQSSRHGPSISPGGPKEAYDAIQATLQKWAAKDSEGRPCVAYIGPGGESHATTLLLDRAVTHRVGTLCQDDTQRYRARSSFSARGSPFPLAQHRRNVERRDRGAI